MTVKKSYRTVRDRIMADYGGWLDGEAIPSERDLALKYDVSRSTVQYALRDLEKSGRIYRIRGKGTFIRKDRGGMMDIGSGALQRNKGISALVKSYGVKISNAVLVCGDITNNKFLADKLKLDQGETIYALHRVRYGNNEPLAIEYTYVPKKFFPDIEELDFGTVSLYDYMDANGHMPCRFDQLLRVARVSPKEARYLELPLDEPAYYFELVGIDLNGVVVEYTESFTRCDKTEFRFTARM